MKINKKIAGFTLVEIMIVVAIIGLLAAIAVPNFVQARNSARSNACINNLRLIDASKEQYAIENNAASGGAVTMAQCTPYLKANTWPIEPASGTYTNLNVIGTYPSCSLSGATAGSAVKSHRLD